MKKPERIGLNPIMETAYEIYLREVKVVDPDHPVMKARFKGGSSRGEASEDSRLATNETESPVRE